MLLFFSAYNIPILKSLNQFFNRVQTSNFKRIATFQPSFPLNFRHSQKELSTQLLKYGTGKSDFSFVYSKFNFHEKAIFHFKWCLIDNTKQTGITYLTNYTNCNN